MENHTFWGRLISKLRQRTSSAFYSFEHNSQSQHTRPNQRFLHRIKTTPVSEKSGENSYPKYRSTNESFIPKCLTGINVQNVLFGQGSIENFSPNCWLENNLHRFGRLTDEQEHDTVNNVSPSNQLSPDSFILSVRAIVMSNQLNTLNQTLSSSSESIISSLASSTISDVTNFYHNLNLSGYAFDPEAIPEDPPPYSELPYDPPPLYTDSSFSTMVINDRSQSNQLHSASFQVFADDACLY